MPSVVSDDGPAHGRSGLEKRRAKAQLPRAVLVYSRERKSIVGAALLCACWFLGDSMVRWQCSYAVTLLEPQVVTAQMFKYMSSVFKLTAAAEIAVRRARVSAGGILSDHFEFSGEATPCLSLSSDQLMHILTTPSSAQFTTARDMARMLTIVPAAAPQPAAPPLENASDDEEALQAPAPASMAHPSAVSPLENASDGEAPTAFVQKRLAGFYNEQAQGSVTHRYNAEGILAYLDLSGNLKPGVPVSRALACCCRLLFGAQANALAQNIETGVVHSPSRQILRAARLRLDYISILYQQKLFLRSEAVHFLLCDSSPQLGRNFFAIIEDTFAIPAESCLNLRLRVNQELQGNYESMLWPLSTLGLGHAAVVNKASLLMNNVLMHVASDTSLHAKRKRYRGMCTDHGTESEVYQSSIDLLPSYRNTYNPGDPDRYFFPNMLGVVGKLHSMWGALEKCVKSSRLYRDFVDSLTVLQSFTSDKALMRKFKATCFEGKEHLAAKFDRMPTIHINWRWETLTAALDLQIPLHPILKDHFNKDALLATDGGGLLSNTIVTSVAKVLAQSDFLPAAEMYRVLGKVTEKYAGLLETCDCHAQVWRRGMKRKRRLTEMRKDIDSFQCCWQGRRLAWWIATGFNEFLEELRHATSPLLQKILLDVDSQTRATLVTTLEEFRTSLLDEHLHKDEYLFHPPFLAIGAFYCTQGGTVAKSQAILKDCLDEVDQAIAGGKQDQLERNTLRLFKPGQAVAEAARSFIARQDPKLEDFPVLYVSLMEYALIPFVERRIEKVHATIKRAGAIAFGASVSQLCAVIRESVHLDTLRRSAEFHAFCVSKWHERSIMDQVLAMRCPKSTLAKMKYREKLDMVYQCGLRQEYADMSASIEAHERFKALTAHTRGAPVALNVQERACVSYLRGVLVPGGCFSMPTLLLESVMWGTWKRTDAEADPDPIGTCLELAAQPLAGSQPGSEFTFFSVVTNNVEQRKLRHTAHLERKTTCVTIRRLNKIASYPGSRYAVSTDMSCLLTLDLRGLVASMRQTMTTLFKWEKTGWHAVPKFVDLRANCLQRLSYCASPAPSIVGEAPSASSTVCDRLVPVSEAVQGGEAPVLDKVALRLFSEGAIVGQKEMLWSDLDGLQFDVLDQMYKAGLVSLRTNEFGETMVALRPEALKFESLVGVFNPRLVHRVFTQGIPPWKRTKLQLVMELVQEGFEPGTPVSTLRQDSDLVVSASWSKPLTYFAALACRQDIWQKVDTGIAHDQVDYYYRCLLFLEGGALATVLEQAAGKGDQWFKAQLGDIGTQEVDDGDGMSAIAAGTSAAGTHVVAQSLRDPVVDVAPELGWTRVVAHLGDPSLKLKIWFDHFSSNSAVQRGFTNCRHHGCIRYTPVCGQVSKERYIAEMVVWHLDGGREDIPDKATHLKHKPSTEAVDAVLSDLGMEDF